jgi:hypothetical protein
MQETRNILADILNQKRVAPQTQQQLRKWFDVITKQNCFARKKK